MSDLKQLCLELDDTLIEFFSVKQDVLSRQYQLECVLKDGYFLMAKARYSMGAKSVGCLQYNENDLDEATVKVITNSDTFIIQKDIELGDEKPKGEESGLRKRGHGVQDIQESVEHTKINSNTTTKDKSCTKKKDPINWFGILLPQALRQSQSRFKKAIEISCELSTLKIKYGKLQSRYRELFQRKQNLLNESLDTDILD